MKTPTSPVCLLCLTCLVTSVVCAGPTRLYSYENTTESLGPGFGDPWNKYAWSMQDYNGYMYVGTTNVNYDLVEAYRNGAFDALVLDPVNPLYGFLGALQPYSQSNGADIWRYEYTSGQWEQVYGNAAGEASGGLRKMETYNGKLYAASSDFTGAKLLSSADGDNWSQVDMTGGPATWSLRAVQTLGDNLYVATDNSVTGGTTSDIYAYNDSTGWSHVTQIDAPGVMELAVRDGQLYAGDSLAKVSQILGIKNLVGAPYQASPATFRLQDKRVTLEGLELKSELAAFGVSGWAQLAGPISMVVTLQIPRQGLVIPRVPPVVLDALTDSNGWIQIPFNVTGTREKPDVTLDLDYLLRQGAAGAGLRLLERLRGN